MRSARDHGADRAVSDARFACGKSGRHPSGSRPLAQAALAGLLGPLRESRHGSWHPSLSAAGVPAPGKSCYDHAFVVRELQRFLGEVL